MNIKDHLTINDLSKMVDDLHALMWAGDGCEICAHCVVVHREPYYKTSCTLEHCDPLWRGFVKENIDVKNPVPEGQAEEEMILRDVLRGGLRDDYSGIP